MDIKMRIDELTAILSQANYQYYVLDDPTMPDYEYDHLLRELEELEKANPALARTDSPTQRVGGEALSKVLNWEDRSTCILFGDGAGAAVVECRAGWPSIGAILGTHGSNTLLRVPGPGSDLPNLISMEGTKVFKFAVETVPWCIDQVLQRHNMNLSDVDFFVFHQANARIIDLVVKKYNIPPEKYYKNLEEYGNTSAASIPLVLSELEDLGKIGTGSKLLVVGFGGGLTWGGALVEFA